jgi:hypothetical protein
MAKTKQFNKFRITDIKGNWYSGEFNTPGTIQALCTYIKTNDGIIIDQVFIPYHVILKVEVEDEVKE